MKILIIVLLLLEAFSLYFMIKKAKDILKKVVIKKTNEVLNRCAVDEKYRNNIASCIFFFQDMGPNVSSFSIIAIIISSDDELWTLILVFLGGIMIKRYSRITKNYFYSEIEKRK